MEEIDEKSAFLNLINKVMNLDEIQKEHLLKFVRYEKVSKNTNILKEGDVCRKFYFNLKGSIRLYFSTKAGKIKTRLVLFEDAPFTALLSFITGDPTAEIIEVLEDSCFAVISREDFYGLVNDLPEWSSFYTMMLEKTYIYQNSRLEQLATLSASERYQKIMKESPHFIQRLSNGVLASYLDVSQETLSRLKSR
ncbi:Crp/Fnr family transcriptional regulator [Pedobacter frigidisoli]|uniref:Crp/Fnr family transcriptional regulator n=1 Tax=Pedobacter frigidisoli TaxID=2530455 RepID=A0A4R0NCE1_9SPHI|nr:Crp/Fnr family transcriptional regulator [Pedobacter frigidisoli]TCC97327.1 Crp/Fnr family transcriptional regulator [Pedobacter frigidisoli]